MGKYTSYILLLITLSFSLPLHSEDSNLKRLPTLESLMDNNLAYTADAPIDSITTWGEAIIPVLESAQQTESYFRIRQFMVQLYAQQGNIGKAIDEARLMYEKAKTMNYEPGMTFASRAIGDAYYCSNMLPEAIDSYKEAINHHEIIPANYHFKEMAILKLIIILIIENRMDEAELYRNELQKSKHINDNITLQFFNHTLNVNFFIKKNNIPRAGEHLKQAEQIYESNPQPYLYPYLYFMQGKYKEALGEYKEALQIYDTCLTRIPYKYRSVNYLHMAYAKANLLVKMDQKKDAVHLYQEISIISDSVVTPSYSHRINNLRAAFEENRMKLENKAELNQILIGWVTTGFIVLLIVIYLVIHIVKQNKKLAKSKIKLEQSRLNAENAMHTKSLFLSNMSHEIRTPLSAISGFSGLLTEKQLDEETRRQCGEIIQKNSDLLLKLINDVIDLSNLGAGNIKFNFSNHDAIAICRNVIETVNNVKQTEAAVLFKTNLDTLPLYTDDSRLQQLLINLLINATKFTPKGSITLEVELTSENVALFSVTDTGCGIAKEKQDKIFNRFEKLNEGAQGTGLGLSICQLIIEKIGGKIWLDSSYTGGCRFCFTHPATPSCTNIEEEGKQS